VRACRRRVTPWFIGGAEGARRSTTRRLGISLVAVEAVLAGMHLMDAVRAPGTVTMLSLLVAAVCLVCAIHGMLHPSTRGWIAVIGMSLIMLTLHSLHGLPASDRLPRATLPHGRHVIHVDSMGAESGHAVGEFGMIIWILMGASVLIAVVALALGRSLISTADRPAESG